MGVFFWETALSEPLTHDVRIWLSATQYAGLLRLAHQDDRPISAYVRRLIQKAIDEDIEDWLGVRHDHSGSMEGPL